MPGVFRLLASGPQWRYAWSVMMSPPTVDRGFVDWLRAALPQSWLVRARGGRKGWPWPGNLIGMHSARGAGNPAADHRRAAQVVADQARWLDMIWCARTECVRFKALG